ncbi:MAG: hypothetical protein AAF824_11500 [Bacteroidota bacterium]
MKLILPILLVSSLLYSLTTSACCAENSYRLFPIGELEKEIVFVEASLYRNCKRGSSKGAGMIFWLKGEINLVHFTNDSLVLLANLDSIEVNECACRPNTQYEDSRFEKLLKPSYLKGIKLASAIPGFRKAKTKSIHFNDTTRLTIKDEVTDSSYERVFFYQEIKVATLSLADIVSRFPEKLVEIREYETPNKQITIIRLRCHFLDERIIKRQIKRFNNLKTAFWNEQAHWHGTSRDYFFIEKK